MSSAFIPKEKLSAYQRWELRSFDGAADAPAAAAGRETEDKARNLSRRAHGEGFDAGYREGAARVAAHAAEFVALLAAMREATAHFDQDIAGEVLGLAVALAQRMVHHALKVHPELVLPLVQEAMHRLAHARLPGKLVLHPADAELVRTHLAEQLAASGWVVCEDARLARGGCRLENAAGELDASVPHRWQRLAAALGETGDWLE